MNDQTLAKVGAIFWLSTVQFYIVQLIAARAWDVPFSYVTNYISDLGRTDCTYEICSPLYGVMNVSFVILGVTMLVGALIFAYLFRKNTGASIGFLCLVISGLGTILVGLFPSNINGDAHGTGAYASFLVGSVGLVVIGLSLRESKRWLRLFALCLGIIAVVSLPLYMNKMYLGLGAGGLERVIAYPQTIWMITFAAVLLKNAANKKIST